MGFNNRQIVSYLPYYWVFAYSMVKCKLYKQFPSNPPTSNRMSKKVIRYCDVYKKKRIYVVIFQLLNTNHNDSVWWILWFTVAALKIGIVWEQFSLMFHNYTAVANTAGSHAMEMLSISIYGGILQVNGSVFQGVL